MVISLVGQSFVPLADNMNNRDINVMKIEYRRGEQLTDVTHSYLIHI